MRVVIGASFVLLLAAVAAAQSSPADAVGGGGGGPPSAEEAWLLPRKLKLKPNAAAPELSRLSVIGQLDTGPDAVDLSQAATLTIGGWSLAAPALATNPSGKLFTFEDEGLKLSVRPSPSGSSRATFRLKAQDDFTGLLVADSDTAVAFESLACEGTSLVTLEGLAFTLGKKPGTLVEPALHLQAARARLKGGGADSLVLRLGLATGGVAPPAAQDLVVGFGDLYADSVPAEAFTRIGSKDVWTGPPGGMVSAVVDHAKERLTVRAKGVDLGAFAEGGNPVIAWVALGENSWAVAVRMVRKGPALKY